MRFRIKYARHKRATGSDYRSSALLRLDARVPSLVAGMDGSGANRVNFNEGGGLHSTAFSVVYRIISRRAQAPTDGRIVYWPFLRPLWTYIQAAEMRTGHWNVVMYGTTMLY